MNGINNYSVRPGSTPAGNTTAPAGNSGESSFAPLVKSALAAATVASAPTASAVASISKEGLTELTKASRDAYRATDALVHSTTSFVGQAIDSVEDAVHDGIADVKAAGRYVGKELSDAGEAVYDGAATVAHAVGHAIDATGAYVGHAVIAGVTALNKVV